jgi:DNA-binding transcriptional LysR family regulator
VRSSRRFILAGDDGRAGLGEHPAVDLRRLRYFVAVAEELHFRRAAARLHLAQGALSDQVRKLERELGVELLDRSQRHVGLTAAGTAFLADARRLLRQADDAAHAARRASTAGRLRMGHPPGALPAALARTIADLATSHPGVQVVPEAVPARRAVDDVRAGRLDVAVVGLPAPTAGLRVTALGSEATVAGIADRGPTGQLGPIPLATLSETPLIVLPRAADPAFQDSITAAFRAAGVAASLVETAEPRVDHALLMVLGGAGTALVPASAAQQCRLPGVRFVPLAPSPATEIGVVAPAETSNTVTVAFLRLAAGTGAAPAPLRLRA